MTGIEVANELHLETRTHEVFINPRRLLGFFIQRVTRVLGRIREVGDTLVVNKTINVGMARWHPERKDPIAERHTVSDKPLARMRTQNDP